MLHDKEETAVAVAAANDIIREQQLKILRRMLNHWLSIGAIRSLISNWMTNRRIKQTSVIGIKITRHLLRVSSTSLKSVFDGIKNAWKQERHAAACSSTTATEILAISAMRSLQQILKRWSSIGEARALHHFVLNRVRFQYVETQKIKALSIVSHIVNSRMTELVCSHRTNMFGALRRNWTDSRAPLQLVAGETLSKQLLAKQHECDKLQQENDAFSQMVEGLESEISRLQVNLQTLHAHPMGSNWHSCFVCLLNEVKPRGVVANEMAICPSSGSFCQT